MRIAISGLLHGFQQKVSKRYPDLKIHFVGCDRDKKPKGPPKSSNHVFIMRRFCSHSQWHIIKNDFGTDNISMINGGITELFQAIDNYLTKIII